MTLVQTEERDPGPADAPRKARAPGKARPPAQTDDLMPALEELVNEITTNKAGRAGH